MNFPITILHFTLEVWCPLMWCCGWGVWVWHAGGHFEDSNSTTNDIRHRLLVRLWIYRKFLLVADPRLHFIFSDFWLWSNPSIGNPSIRTQVLMIDNSLAGGKAWFDWNVTPTCSYINDLSDLGILCGYGMLHLRELLQPDKASSMACEIWILALWRVLVNTILNFLLCIANQ